MNNNNYWYEGLELLLQGQEEEAQMVWLSAIAEGTPEQVELWLTELANVLSAEAEKQETIGNYDRAWLIRLHIRENAPEDLDNLHSLGNLCLQLDETEAAIAYFRTCIAIDPACRPAYQSLGSIYQQQGKIVFILQPQVQLSVTEENHGKKLNLGCGQNLLQGYINVDKFGDPDVRCDLEVFPWIWEDNSIDKILLNHVLEHLGASTEVYLGIIKEMYRVCRPNALIYINVPHPRHDDFLNDPTHVRAVTPDGLMLFSQAKNREWATVRAANSPLGLYLNVDLELVDFAYTLDEPWYLQYVSGAVNSSDMMQNIRIYNNVAKQIEITLKVVKDCDKQLG
jgi:tetratricopeptide (TPR) repeat protein